MDCSQEMTYLVDDLNPFKFKGCEVVCLVFFLEPIAIKVVFFRLKQPQPEGILKNVFDGRQFSFKCFSSFVKISLNFKS